MLLTIQPSSPATALLPSHRSIATPTQPARITITRGCSSMAEPQLPKLMAGVRFPSPARFIHPPSPLSYLPHSVAHSANIVPSRRLLIPFLKEIVADFAAAEGGTTLQRDRVS